jgi:hypothetical protein
MKKKSLLWMLGGMMAVLAIGAFMILGSTAPGNAGKPTTATQTGQAIMANLTGGGTYTIVETQTYKYNKDTAAGYFTNAYRAASVVLTNTQIQPGNPSCTPPDPTVPTPPAPIVAKLNDPNDEGVNDVVGQNRCSFLNGTRLTGTTYYRTATASSTCDYTNSKGKVTTYTRTDTYTYTYDITPIDPGQFAAFTAWDLMDIHGSGLAAVNLGVQIAGESWMTSKQFPLPKGKFSFSMVDNGANRVENLQLVITDASGATVYDSSYDYPLTSPASYLGGIPSTVVTNAPGALAGAPGALDFFFKQNAGTNGVTTYLKNDDARTILNTDIFSGNDNGGADGSALAEVIMSQVTAELDFGTYSVTLTGVVKGNSALAVSDEAFSVSKQVNVVTPGCGNNP